jgi:hypothetical protein
LSRVDAVGRSDAFLTRHEATKSLKVVEKSPSSTGDGFYNTDHKINNDKDDDKGDDDNDRDDG